MNSYGMKNKIKELAEQATKLEAKDQRNLQYRAKGIRTTIRKLSEEIKQRKQNKKKRR